MAQVAAAHDPRLARQLILDELFDLSLYTALRDISSGDVRATLEELIGIEQRHFEFWQEFSQLRLARLDVWP